MGQVNPIPPFLPYQSEYSRKQQKPVDACAQAKCSYCGRFGPLGQCIGCGAPNTPAQFIDGTSFADGAVRRLIVSEIPCVTVRK